MTVDNIERAQVDIPSVGIGGGASGPAASRDQHEAELARDAESMLSTLRQVGRWVEGVRGRRKAILLFSEGINYNLNNLLDDGYVNGRDR